MRTAEQPSYRARLSGLLLAALLGGCTVGPDYEKPEIHTPDEWYANIVGTDPQEPAAPIQTWWELFNDPVLNTLIEDARQSNLTLQMALASVREARARLAFAGGANLPTVGAGGQVTATKLSNNGVFNQMAPPGGFQSQGMMVFGLDAAWEFDVFGRIRREVEAEGARFEASVEEYRDVMVSLYAEVAVTYIDIRGFQAQIANAEENIKVQAQSLELAEERFKDGLTSQLDVEQAKSNLYETKAAVPQYRIHLNEALNRMAVLCGQDAGSLRTIIGDAPTLPTPTMSVEAGVPAELLRQRPDIRQAEREAAAATAMIGAAKANLYPKFALKGSVGLESHSVSSFFDSSSIVWTAAAPIHWNIFTGGRVLDDVKVKEAQRDQAILNYRQSVLDALEEVENALVSYHESRVRQGYLVQAIDGTETSVELVTIQYENGLTDFDNVLNMQRTLYLQEHKLITSHVESLRSVVALYKALGGGWSPDAQLDHEAGEQIARELAATPSSGRKQIR